VPGEQPPRQPRPAPIYNANRPELTVPRPRSAGAFTPTCSLNHLPGYIGNLAAFKAKGVDVVAVLAYNDPFVMSAWSKANDVRNDDIVGPPLPPPRGPFLFSSVLWSSPADGARVGVLALPLGYGPQVLKDARLDHGRAHRAVCARDRPRKDHVCGEGKTGRGLRLGGGGRAREAVSGARKAHSRGSPRSGVEVSTWEGMEGDGIVLRPACSWRERMARLVDWQRDCDQDFSREK
jgi:hypothetical protein